MKKAVSWFASVTLVILLSGCSSIFQSSYQTEILESLSGTWYSESEDLVINGSHIEFTGYYQYNGHRMAGTIREGKLDVQPDGTFFVEDSGSVQVGYLEDEYSLVIGNQLYRR